MPGPRRCRPVWRACALAATLLVASADPQAQAAPFSPVFKSGIETLARYDGQDTCDPTEKPGVAEFLAMLRRTYPGHGSMGIIRACGVGGTSEHKEGRALDWAANAGSAAHVADVNDLMSWLLATDELGVPYARARRLGVMYMIFNRKVWKSYQADAGWQDYTGANPHTDHVHFSFAWSGAMRQTTWWTGAPGPAELGAGSFMATSAGTVHSVAAPLLGSVPRPNRPIVGIAASPSGKGYRLVASDGGIFTFGDATFHGSTGDIALHRPIVGMASTASGKGYWLVAADGGVFSFGDAVFHGSTGAVALQRPIVGMSRTRSGDGYWLVASDGGVFSFGDARFHGSTGAITLQRPIVGMARTASGDGYWMVASDGGIFSFGDARFFGSTGAQRLVSPIVGMEVSPNGQGYALTAGDGGRFTFGDAPFRGSAAGHVTGRVVGSAAHASTVVPPPPLPTTSTTRRSTTTTR